MFSWSLPTQRWRHAHFSADRTDAIGGWDPPFDYWKGQKLPKLGNRMSTSLRPVNVGVERGWTFFIVLDRSVTEVFLNDGAEVGTMGFWPWEELDRLVISSTGTAGAVRTAIRVTGLG